MNTNKIIELAERVQRDFRKNIVTRVVGQIGPSHSPTITIEIELPDGKIFQASGSNQKLAKVLAAEEALVYLDE